MRLLLLSNSRNPGQGYLEHVRREIPDFLGSIREIVFVPYAGVQMSPAQYTEKVRQAFAELGIAVTAVTEAADPAALVREAKAVAVGGGNSFQLLRLMSERELLPLVRDRVRAGMPYVGWSAGSNLACPTIRTTNDMPIVEPPSLTALGLVPFQINPHYTDQVIPNHGGESRDDRLAEFLVLNPEAKVLGLREGSWIRVEGKETRLCGPHTARLFAAGIQPIEVEPGLLRLTADG
jgi:dipeptidase E